MDRGAWQATVHGVAKESDDWVTKPQNPAAVKSLGSMLWVATVNIKTPAVLSSLHHLPKNPSGDHSAGQVYPDAISRLSWVRKKRKLWAFVEGGRSSRQVLQKADQCFLRKKGLDDGHLSPGEGKPQQCGTAHPEKHPGGWLGRQRLALTGQGGVFASLRCQAPSEKPWWFRYLGVFPLPLHTSSACPAFRGLRRGQPRLKQLE